MIKNYLKIAIRTLWKNKMFSVVNIVSLSLSMAVGVILFTSLKATYDTDHFHPNLNRIVRILTQETKDGEKTTWATAPLPLAALMDSISFIDKTVSVRLGGKYNVQTERGDVPVDIKFTESFFFDVFGFELLSGSPQSLADNSRSLFLSERTAEKIFGKEGALGQTVQFESLGSFTVAGIIRDPPLETHLPIEGMLSIQAAEMLEKKGAISDLSQNWNIFKNSAVYALLTSKERVKQLNATLQNYSRNAEKSRLQFLAQPLEDITPGTGNIKNDAHAGVDWTGIKTQLFLILALTLLSAFNYVSLALARAFSRAGEIGVRKTIGATRGQIVGQFLIESILVSLLAMFFTVPAVRVLMDFIPDMDMTFSPDIILLSGLLTYAVVTGLVAGALPSWLLSAFKPVHTLRKMKNLKLFRSISFYKILVVVQFSVASMLMIFFVILTDYEIKNNARIQSTVPPEVLTLDLKGEAYTNLQNEISGLSQVENTIATNWFYDALKTETAPVRYKNKTLKIDNVSIDPKTIITEGIELKAGQGFPENMPQSSEQFVLVNEAAAKLLQSGSENLVGQNLLVDSAYVQVTGIMPDQFFDEPSPLIYRYLPNEMATLIIKIKPNTQLQATKAIQSVWKRHFPEKTADLQNLKDRYSGESSKERIGFFGFFALLVMVIAALGILGIAGYSVETRTKELGVRKVLGATALKLVWTSSKSFGILILIAGLIGVPAGLLCGNLLREEMGSRVDLSLINTGLGFGLVAVIGLLTVLSQTIRAARIKPVKVLKAE